MSEELPEDSLSWAKEFRNRSDTLTFNECALSGFDIRGSNMGGFGSVEVEEGGFLVELEGVWVGSWRASIGG